MKNRGFKTFYGDGELVGYRIGPGEAVAVFVDTSFARQGEIRTIWFGRIQNFDAVCEFLKGVGPPNVGEWRRGILELGLDPATARGAVKRVSLALSGRGDQLLIIDCKDVSESS